MEKELKGVYILYNGLALKVIGICFDPVKKSRGQFGRRLDLGCSQILGQDSGCGTEVGTYV